MINTDKIPYGRQWINEEDIQAVVEVLRSDRITQGPIIEEFERALADYCEAKYAVAVNSATSGLHIASLVAGVGNGDEVITSPNTFVASANCVVYCGARPIFADIEKTTYNISPSEIDRKISANTKAVIPVHFAGQSCRMEQISQIVEDRQKKYGRRIFIIEDASHALGSIYLGTKVGSCAYSDMAVMSFHPVKHITTGEGGAVLTNDERIYEKLKILRSHGIVKPREHEEPGNPWYYEQVDLGFNYRMTDFQSALGLSQLARIRKFLERRREIVDIYNKSFSSFKAIQTPYESEECISNFHLYVLLFDWEKVGMNRAQFMNELMDSGVMTQVHYIPVHTQPFYQKRFGARWGDCPEAERYYQKCLSIPLFPAMSDAHTRRVLDAIFGVIKRD